MHLREIMKSHKVAKNTPKLMTRENREKTVEIKNDELKG